MQGAYPPRSKGPARDPAATLVSFEAGFETLLGRQAQVDFAHLRTVFTNERTMERVV